MSFHKIFNLLRAPICSKHNVWWSEVAFSVVYLLFVYHWPTSVPSTNAFLGLLEAIGSWEGSNQDATKKF